MSNCENKECGAYVNDSVVLNCGAFEDKFLLHCDAYILNQEPKCPTCGYSGEEIIKQYHGVPDIKLPCHNCTKPDKQMSCGNCCQTNKNECLISTKRWSFCGNWTKGEDYTVTEYKKVTLIEPKPDEDEYRDILIDYYDSIPEIQLKELGEKLTKVHEKQRDGDKAVLRHYAQRVLDSEKEIEELKSNLDEAQNERDDQTVSLMKQIIKAAKYEVEITNLNSLLDKAVEGLENIFQNTGNTYIEKITTALLKEIQEGRL